MQANTHKDFSANSKQFMNTGRFTQDRPVVDNEHQAYLKTHLMFLEPKGNNGNAK
jgi:hypothetical protein